MADAVELDISLLLPRLLPYWPRSFSDLNAARNYVQARCWEWRFRYTYYADVEPSKFRRFVNFNVAKRAYNQEQFVLVDGADERVGNEFTVSTAPYGPVVRKGPTMTSVLKSLGDDEERVPRVREANANVGIEVESEIRVETPAMSTATDDTLTNNISLGSEVQVVDSQDKGEEIKPQEDRSADPFEVCIHPSIHSSPLIFSHWR
jgi:hypothetical protein